MSQLKAKLCKSEHDLNEFLKTLETSTSIHYKNGKEAKHSFHDVKFSTVATPEGIQETFLVIYFDHT